MKTKQVLLTVLFMMFFLPLWGREQHEYDFVVDGWGYSKGYQYHFDGPPTFNGDTTKLALHGDNRNYQGVFTIPESIAGYPVTQIGGGCGASCQLSGLVIPNSITSWLYGVFSNCQNLTSVVLGDNITRLEECFQACPNLSKITFGENFNLAFDSFRDGFFGDSQNFNAATDITWNAINGSIEEKYFPNLQTLTLGEKVQVLPNDFMQATQITSLSIPASVKSIGKGAFVGSNKLESITVASGNTEFDSRNNCNALISTSTNELLLGCANTVIPSTVTAIGNKAFWKNPLTEVTLPELVTKIGNYAFADCRNLKQVQLNEGLTSIGYRAFYNCNKIEEIILPQSVSEMGGVFYGCTSLKRIFVCNPRPVPISSNDYEMFFGVDKENCVLYVPKGSLATYWAATGWNKFKNIVEFDPANIHPMATSLTLNQDDLIMYTSEDVQLMAEVLPELAIKQLAWTSSQPDVVTVSNNGTVMALAQGTATISVSTTDGSDLTENCNVTVRPGLRGDADGNGKLNVSDVSSLINMILGVTEKNVERADVNGDSKLNVSDISALINMILGVTGWVPAGTCTFTDFSWTGTEQTADNVPVQHLAGTNKYRIVSPLVYVYNENNANLDDSDFPFLLDDDGTFSINDGVYLNWWGCEMYYDHTNRPTYCYTEREGDTFIVHFLLKEFEYFHTDGCFWFIWNR